MKRQLGTVAGQWDPYWHMVEELHERTDKGKPAAAKSAIKKAASARKAGGRK